ncbi:MAG TPA: rod shape-determining protein MreD [Candidatus Methylomirabilis sp.]|nr:rod shape-determining protein MreD [Candidatus Methylomirabilis sp.]
MSVLLLALLSVCLLQSTVAPRLAIGGVQPDLFLVLVFGLSLSAGPELAIAGAFLIGLYQDSLSGAPLGLNAFTLSLIAFLVGQLSRQVKTTELTARFALLFLAAVASGLTTLLVLRFFQVFRPFASTILWTVLPGAIYTAALGAGLLAMPKLRGIRGLGR